MFTSPTIHFPCGHLPTIYIIIHVMNSYRSHMTNMTYCAHCSKPYILRDILYICIHMRVLSYNQINAQIMYGIQWYSTQWIKCQSHWKLMWNLIKISWKCWHWTWQCLDISDTHSPKKIVKLKWKRLKLKCLQPMNEKVTLFYNGIQSISLQTCINLIHIK